MDAADSEVILLPIIGAVIEWEFHSNPLINGLIQHSFKIHLLFVEHFYVVPLDYTKRFPVDHKSP